MGNFKNLVVWQDAIVLAESVYGITKTNPFSKDFGLRDQIQRASVSIASNIAEGYDRGSDKESIRFFKISKGSAAEVITQLQIAYRIGYINIETLENLENLAQKIRASLNNLIKAFNKTLKTPKR